ncbi:transporter substrate-binding domain-containing protein [Marinobacter zhejiangensis]|uniref:Amino acid ABC transporter substrate-binding protein, PAAT family n=1 Tax=Marinobacter zhejiangensis TaxID=488535 RepID=A0A1I4LR80_9GAMM|nr:transporter substrate-binding domain-containing protein [Marinobacter zhejiangensis]SFL93401.1 amino acid ABC transporter substrate-binding protein, PAAT family [Marinobacter zhejiangensis]
MTRLFSALTLFITWLAVFPLAQADTLDDILERKTLRVGVSMFAPWTIEAADDQLIGFEVDLANKLAGDLGVDTELKVYEWDKIIAALQQGEIDVIAAGMAITPHRALQVNFSLPYMTSGVTLATNTGKTQSIHSLEQLNQESVVITSVTDSFGNELAATLFDRATQLPFATKEEAQQAITSGRAHAYVASVPETLYLALDNPGTIDLPLGKPLVASKAGLAVRRGEQEWLNFLNAWVTVHQADGWLDTNYAYWFKSLDWQTRVAAQ